MKKINQLIENYLNWSNDSKKFIKIFQILFYYILYAPLLKVASYPDSIIGCEENAANLFV